jgi:sporulation integral membrane protein YlbJ
MFNIFLLIFPQIVLTASRDGLLLWFNNVLPTLLPFMIATNMLISLGFAEFLADLLSPYTRKIFNLPGAAAFGIIAGITSGYPVGAKTVADLKKTGQLSTQEAQHLLSFCNNAGPLFILGVVGAGMFENVKIGYFLWFTHVFSAFMVGLIFRKKNNLAKETLHINHLQAAFSKYRENRRCNAHSIGKILGDAVKNAMESMTIIGGLIIFFSVIVALLEKIILPDAGIFSGIIAGAAEVTGGTRRLSAIEPTLLTLGATAFVIAFGGLSVHAQSFHFTSGTGIKNGKYLFAKFLHGIFAAAFMIILYELF